MYYITKVCIIIPNLRIGIMVHNSDAGNGVIGIIECNNLEPLNHKQAFNEAKPAFKQTEKWLEQYVV